MANAQLTGRDDRPVANVLLTFISGMPLTV